MGSCLINAIFHFSAPAFNREYDRVTLMTTPAKGKTPLCPVCQGAGLKDGMRCTACKGTGETHHKG